MERTKPNSSVENERPSNQILRGRNACEEMASRVSQKMDWGLPTPKVPHPAGFRSVGELAICLALWPLLRRIFTVALSAGLPLRDLGSQTRFRPLCAPALFSQSVRGVRLPTAVILAKGLFQVELELLQALDNPVIEIRGFPFWLASIFPT